MSDLQDLDESTFPDFVADLWDRQGWTTRLQAVEDETYVAAVRPEAGERGLIWAKSGRTGARVDAEGVVTFAKFCKENGVDDAAILTLGAFTQDGEAAAEKFDIDLLDGEHLARVVERHDLANLVDEHATGGSSGSAEGALAPLFGVLAALDVALPLDGVGSPQQLVATLQERLGERNVEIPRQVGVATVVVVALVVAGVVLAPSIAIPNPLGGGGDEQVPAAVAVTAGPVQPEGATTTIYAEYNTTTRQTIDVNPDDEKVHVAPNGSQFVVVALSLVNTGEEAVDLRPAAFTLSANGTTYRYQPLVGADGFWETNLAAGDSYEGWIVFVVPEDTPKGTLGIDQGAVRGSVAVQFAPNPGLAVNTTM